MNISKHTVGEARRFIRENLKKSYPDGEISSLTSIILKNLTGLSLSSIMSQPEKSFNDNLWDKLNQICVYLKEMMPIQYILGETEFYGYTLKVGPEVLIPRPETEELVKLIIENHSAQGLKIIDIGTGSGSIAISLACEMDQPHVTAMDIDRKVIELASKNSVINNAQVNFMIDDILNPSANHGKYDIIVSNPPYIREFEKMLMGSNVLDYEPHSALFVPDNDPLVFYRAIMQFSDTRLEERGSVYFEINEALGHEMLKLVKNYGYNNVSLFEDINGKTRMLKASKDG